MQCTLEHMCRQRKRERESVRGNKRRGGAIHIKSHGLKVVCVCLRVCAYLGAWLLLMLSEMESYEIAERKR